jgi:XapX domain-containing protein
MRLYVISLAVGVLVGIIYALLNVRSPAPPVVALIGLLGMLIGEQVVPAAKRVMAGLPITSEWMKTECVPHVFGELPTKPSTTGAQPRDEVRT